MSSEPSCPGTGILPFPARGVQLVSNISMCSRYFRDIDYLRDTKADSTFACVYTTDRGRYRARVLKRMNLDSFPTPDEAAKAVVSWYQWWYGTAIVGGCPQWLLAFYARKANPWRVKRITKFGITGYVCDVYYQNQPVRVTRRTWRFPGAVTPKWYRRMSKYEREAVDNYFWARREDAVREAQRVIRARMRQELGLFAVNALQLFWRGKDRRMAKVPGAMAA